MTGEGMHQTQISWLDATAPVVVMVRILEVVALDMLKVTLRSSWGSGMINGYVSYMCMTLVS